MDTKLKQYGRSAIIWLLLALLINLTITAVFADGWKANDAGNDDPDGINHWWFAPDSVRHNMWWWDVDQPGAMDQVLDDVMRWQNDVQDWFRNQPDRNLVHEVRTGNDVYEANDWYWTNLPQPDLNEDSNDFEEWVDGYEEKEIGWDEPATQIPGGVDKTVYTGFNSLNDGDTYFESESELTRPWQLDNWFPEQWDVLGRMNIQGAN